VGLKPSPGKTFYSDQFCNMNSAQFNVIRVEGPALRSGPRELSVLVRVPHINMGLVYGMGRSVNKVDTSNVFSWGGYNSISQCAHTLVNQCAEEDRERVFKAYLDKIKTS